MNFVDVQPKSFLDYAWTTPSPAPANAAKPSKTSRKQNRCCDQCRKGKRACDAAILEDTLLDTHGSNGGNPTVFHYSDVFGPLAPCGNCEKTKKTCTFDWLRSQRVSQAAPQAASTPPAKRRRKSSSSNSSQNRSDAARHVRAAAAPQPTTASGMGPTGGANLAANEIEHPEYSLTFADFPSGIPAFDMDLSSPFPFRNAPPVCNRVETSSQGDMGQLSDVMEEEEEEEEEAEEEEEEEDLVDQDSGKGSSIETSSDGMYDSLDGESPSSHGSGHPPTCMSSIKSNRTVIRVPRKRRRRGSCAMASNGRLPYSTPSPSNDFLCTTNNSFLTEGLLKIYHDSFENALSCWLTERTCPYSKGSDVSLANDTGPDWNRIYHRVFRLDRLASPIRGRNLTFQEDKAASKALNLAIFSFATQWAQSSERSKAKYPFHSDRQDDQYRVFNANASESISTTRSNFDRTLQISAWREARLALQNATEIDSFRVVLAQIVFSLAQRPMELNDKGQLSDNSMSKQDRYPQPDSSEREQSSVQAGSDDESMSECEDLLSKLDLTIEEEGPPIHLEQGLRLIHSLRSRMAMSGRMQTPPSRIWSSRCGKPPKSSHNRLDAADRATVDLLFWLGVMFDTLSSAMHKRPLVVSDEDSDIYSSTPRPTSNDVSNNSPSLRPPRDQATETQGLWDDYLFAHQRKRLSGNLVRWPCPHEQATSLLCDAAPVKVLLFRKVTRIQTLLSRNVKGERVERAVKAALDVYNHWATLYAPFIGDCIQNHDSLPARIQSWYICLTSHWHLATLLLADLIEITDTSELGVDSVRRNRMSSDFVATFRETNCCALSDIARCACPRDDATFAKSSGFHFAVNQGALLTEPWTAVVIRAFAKAGVILLESETLLTPQLSIEGSKEEAFRRADDCVRALWYLGRKSDMALNAAKILGDALKQRRKGAEEKMNDMSSFLQAELWEGFDEMGGAFGVECV